MKKFLFLLCSLLATVGAWAGTVEVNTTPDESFNDNASAYYIGIQMPGTTADTYALSGFSVYENSGYGAADRYAAFATVAPSSASSWTLSENEVLGVSNENTQPTAAGFVDYTLASSIQVKGGTTYYVVFLTENVSSAGVFTVGAQRVRLISNTTYEPIVCLGNGAVRSDLTPGFKATLTSVGGGDQEPIYIETDVTSSFSALTKNTNWKTGAGGNAGYTATNFCPAVTTNAGQTVQVCEFYEGNCDRTGDILYQTVTGLAPGVYQIELYGAAAYTFGRGFSSEAFATGEWQAGQSINENTGVTLYAKTSEGDYGGEIPIYYATDFPNGAATVNLNNVVVGSNGEVKIGMTKTSKSTNWHVIQLKGVTAKMLASDALEAAVTQAEAIDEASVPAKVYGELQSALAAAKDLTTAEAYKAAIEAIEAAIAKANKYAGAKAYFDKMGAVLDKTNVYTEEAYNSVYGTWLADYEAGTLDEATMSKLTADLAYSTGWHSASNIDDVLLSAWTIGGEQAHEFDKALYINTWSVEGANDGTEFLAPFFEYWTGDDNSLGANALTATVTGLEAGADYEVSVWARVRAKNNVAAADATGITLTVGDGEAVDVTEGEAVGQFNLAQYKATGKADANGTLTITFDVAADNNISWLSYQNVMCTKAGDAPLPSDPYEAAMATITEGKAYLISTKVGGKDYYLTTEGTLTADEFGAAAFVFSPESPAKDAFKPVGWYLGVNFTNPNTEDGTATGQFINEGHIRVYGEFRADYECEVFFYNGEAYAIRATNKYKGESQASEWGANTFWTAIDGELPTAGYTLEQEYRWILTEVANPNAQDLKNAIAAINETVANKTGVGPYLFQKSEADLKALADAADAQKAVANNANATAEQIQAGIAALAVAQAAYNKAGNLPEEGTKFTLKSKDADLYASFKETEKNQGLAGLSATPVEFTWTAAEDGSYYLTDGTNFYGFAHAWNVSTDEASKQPVTFQAVELEDGLFYTIKTPNSYLGIQDGKVAEGMRVLSDKKLQDDNHPYWIISPNEAVQADPYDAAVAAIKDGANYTIFTEVNGQNYYLKADGYLTADANEAYKFTFTAINSDGKYKPTGWNLGCKFTNPGLTNGASGDIVNDAHIHVGSNDRDDWERQVFFLQGDKYAVRSTNANSENWGANTYWNVFEGTEMPEAGYSLEPAYVWQLQENLTVDVVCNLVEDGAVTATATKKVLVGEAPTAPASFNLDKFRGLYTFTPDVKEVTEATTTVNFTPEFGAFKFSKSFDKANWYNMNIRSGWYVSKLETEPYYMNNVPTAEEKASPEYQWAFLPVEGEPFQIIILNRASAGQSLTNADGNVVMRDGEFKWEIFGNNDGFVLRPVEGEGIENMWVNQNGGAGADKPLQFWNSTNGRTDNGSTFRVELVEAAPEGIEYAGIIEQTQSHPQAGPMGTTTTDQTVTIANVDDTHVNVTFSGFTLPMAAMGAFNEFTIANVNAATAEDGSISYALDAFSVSTQMGQMTVNYAGTLEGKQASADATPVFHLTLQNATTDDCYFGADQAAIDAYKAFLNPDPYEAAMASIEDGKSYRIFTEVDGKKYYLTPDGRLSDNAQKAACNTFTKVAGAEYEYGFNLVPSYYTNPPVGGNPTLNLGYIQTDPGSARKDWEAQVFLLKGGKYAVRATNAAGGESGWAVNAKTFWTVSEGENGPVAEYSNDENYVWQIEAFVDERPELLASIKNWAKLVQDKVGLVTEGSQYTSNAPDPDEGAHIEYLLDGNFSTYFHTTWRSNTTVNEDHYLQAYLPDGTKDFLFYFVKRDPVNNGNCNNRPTRIDISTSNDGVNFTAATTVTEGLPAGSTKETVKPVDFMSQPITLSENSKYIRFTVPTTNNGATAGGHVFFTFSEFYILPNLPLVQLMPQLVENYMGVTNYTDLSNADMEDIKSLLNRIDRIETVVPVPTPTEESPYGFYGDELAEVDEEYGSDYYLYNIGTREFLTGANSWGTQASRNEVGTRFTVELSEGKYTFDSHVSNGGNSHYLGSNAYVDAAPFGFTLEPVADDTEGVTIYTISDGTNLLKANAENTVVALDGADATDQMAQWMLVSASERLKKLAYASPTNPVDATFMIACSEFSRNDQYKNSWNGGPAIGGNNDNMCAEKWNTNFDVNQVVKYIPAGQYEVSVLGFYRAGNPSTDTGERNAYLYANGVETPLMAVSAGAQDAAGNGYSTLSNDKYIPNSMADASTIFSAGGYADNKLTTTVFDLTMTIGVKKEVAVAEDWTIFDSFRIKYLGYDATATLAAAAAALAQKVIEAEAFEETLDSEAAAVVDAAVKNNNKAYNTSWEYAIAINNIQEAIDKVKAAAGKEDMPIVTGIEGILAEGNDAIYDLSGRKVSKVQKGIYIVNGKKIAVK